MFEKKLNSPSWECIHFIETSRLGELLYGIDRSVIAVLEADFRDTNSEHSVFEKLASALRFPDYFGRNWNSVDECLGDLEWMPAQGYVLIIHNSHSLWSSDLGLAGKLLSSWLSAAETWGKAGIPFHLVLPYIRMPPPQVHRN